jgi:hypothetical protein
MTQVYPKVHVSLRNGPPQGFLPAVVDVVNDVSVVVCTKEGKEVAVSKLPQLGGRRSRRVLPRDHAAADDMGVGNMDSLTHLHE